MQKMVSAKQQTKNTEAPETDVKSTLQKVFVGRAWEVYNAANQQYPQLAEQIFRELAQLIRRGQIREQITGERLYELLRQIGLDVRLDTKIQVLEHGEVKSLADKFRGN